MTESEIQKKIRIACNTGDCRAWRNNIAKVQIRGRWIDFGIPGKGGSDLIGFQSVTITPGMVGEKIAVFLAIECKTATGKASPEQKKFIEFIKKSGGIAGIARSCEDAEKILKKDIDENQASE
jgi:hypothetical protein